MTNLGLKFILQSYGQDITTNSPEGMIFVKCIGIECPVKKFAQKPVKVLFKSLCANLLHIEIKF